MSLSVSALVRPIGRRFLNCEAKHVLMTLATYAADDGGSCYPSQRRIADETCLDVRTVRSAVRRLAGLGFVGLAVTPRGRAVTRYRLNLSAIAAAAELCRGARHAPLRQPEPERRGAPDAPLRRPMSEAGTPVEGHAVRRRGAPGAPDPSVPVSTRKETGCAGPPPAAEPETPETVEPGGYARPAAWHPAPKAGAHPGNVASSPRPPGPMAEKDGPPTPAAELPPTTATPPPFRVSVAIASAALDDLTRAGHGDFASVKEETKTRHAQQGYAYDGEQIGKAVEAAIVAAAKDRRATLARLRRVVRPEPLRVAQKPAQAAEPSRETPTPDGDAAAALPEKLRALVWQSSGASGFQRLAGVGR